MDRTAQLHRRLDANSLLEREREIAAIADWLDNAKRGTGHFALILGGAGIGKTVLLAQARSRGQDEGMQVLTARGGDIDREMSFGIARQLFEALLRQMTPNERRGVLAGAAAHVRPLFDGSGHSTEPSDPLAVVHGLYWLAANLADRNPLLLVIDDVHWADAQTLRWLGYLAPRTADTPLVVLAAARAAEPAVDPLFDAVSRTGDGSVTTLEPLSRPAVAELVRRQFESDGAPGFVAACRNATGGNPFFVRELLRAAAADGIEPVDASAVTLTQIGPREVARYVLIRLAKLGDAACRFANVVAILGGDAQLRHAAALAGMSSDDAMTAWDQLAHAEILRSSQPLDFIHPIVRAAVYAELARGERSRLRRQAAAILALDDAGPEAIAVHALACEPAGDAEVVTWLRRAAKHALVRGAPDAAARYLQRARNEPPARELRPQVNLELGQSLVGLDTVRAAEVLAAAAQTEDRGLALSAQRLCAYALCYAARMSEAQAAYDRAIEIAGTDIELVLHLTGTRDYYAAWWAEDRNRAERRQHLEDLAESLDGQTHGELQVLGALAVSMVLSGSAPARRALELVQTVRRRDVEWFAPNGDIAQHGVLVVEFACDDPRAAMLCREKAIPEAMHAGRIMELSFAHLWQASIQFRQGALVAAEASARTSWELVRTLGDAAATVYAWSASGLAQILLERGRLDEAEDLYETAELDDPTLGIVIFPWPQVLKGRLALAQGRTAEGVEILFDAGAWLEQRGFTNPSYTPWRTHIAPALASLGRVEEARDAVEPAVERARAFGAPWGLGSTLRAAGTVEQGERGIALLREAVAVLEPSPCRLEHAHALLELGATLRRCNARAAARDHLRAALDMAHRCGAAPLADRAEQELAATGARPRRIMLSGLDSLTASERRAAELAATGLSNREIAQQLFVTRKTIEKHLGQVYLKLDIHRRQELSDALRPGPSAI